MARPRRFRVRWRRRGRRWYGRSRRHRHGRRFGQRWNGERWDGGGYRARWHRRRGAAGQQVHRRRSVRLPARRREDRRHSRSADRLRRRANRSRRARPTRSSTPPPARASFMAAPTAWNGGATDASSGDKAWWFTFTSVTTPGDYYVLDVDRSVRSYPFQISDQVYRNVLKQAVRDVLLSARRTGQDRGARRRRLGRCAPASWARCRIRSCRLFNDKNNAATERDLRGGWYDAGDLNKYTSWTAGYVAGPAARLRREPHHLERRLRHPRVGQRHPRRARRGEVGARLPRAHAEPERLGAQHRRRAVGQPAVGGDRTVPVRAGEHVGDAGHRRGVRDRRAHPEAARQRRR